MEWLAEPVGDHGAAQGAGKEVGVAAQGGHQLGLEVGRDLLPAVLVVAVDRGHADTSTIGSSTRAQIRPDGRTDSP